ncbi:Cell surface glycoprotein 1 [Rhizoctonia solani]|uniref:Cell surface glycoprotein 1 n=1 Tax=Rhizoctonia solani TaxID=456999 RepID=A0A0K6GDH3_9AGAM|nr:Cell surface glycoprotein 1 [Rhizoctonia solani]
MALRARYGPGNRAWSYQRPAEDTTDGAPPLPSAFGLTLSADEHTPVPEARDDADAPTQTAADAARNANGTTKGRGKSDGASAARAARAAKASAARSARASGGGQAANNIPSALPGAQSAPRRRSGRVPATTVKARGTSPTHTTAPQRTVKRKRSTLVSDAVASTETDPAIDSQLPRDGLIPPSAEGDLPPEQAPPAPRAPRASGAKRPRVSQKDLDVKPPRGDEGDDARRTTFGSTTSAPDPFTALSVADLVLNQEQSLQTQIDSAATTSVENPHGANFRRLPPGVPVHRHLSGLYRRYPVSQVGLPKEVITEVSDLDTNVALPPTTIPNAAPFLNLYAPRRTRGIGADKHGLCPICAEPPSRGGRGKAMMLNMKTSAFNYHMQYVHGMIQTTSQSLHKLTRSISIFDPASRRRPFFGFPFLQFSGLSPKTGLPFSPPIAFRSTPRKTVGAREKATLEEGLCHACARWVIIEGVKAVEVLVPEIYWWKHASTCHKSRMLDGEGDFYTEDALFKRIVQWQRDHPAATRASTTTPVAPRKEEPMDIDLSGPDPTGSRTGAMTPVRPNADEPDSSPLSSLDGTDGTRVSPGRKASAPALQYPPTSRGPFGPPSPSARARSAEASLLPPPGVSFPTNPISTPQLANHALPGTLPGTPQTTASVTPVLPTGTLPIVAGSVENTDAESRSVVDSGVALSPHEQSKSIEGEMDGDAEAEGEDEDAEGEDDPTATAENTPVISQLPILAPLPAAPAVEQALTPVTKQESIAPAPIVDTEQASAPSVPQEQNTRTEQGVIPNTDQEISLPPTLLAVPVPDAGSSIATLGQGSIDEPNGTQQKSLPDPMEGLEPESAPTEPQAQIPEDVQMADAPITPAPVTEPNPAPITEPQVELLDSVEEPIVPLAEMPQQEIVPTSAPALDTSTALSLTNDVIIPSIPAELPAIQEMDMYANNTTPNGQDAAQLLTETDLALANTELALAGGDMGLVNGLTGAEMSLVSEEITIPGVELELPSGNLEAVAVAAPNEQVATVQDATTNVSSGAGTPNAGETDIFAFWNA